MQIANTRAAGRAARRRRGSTATSAAPSRSRARPAPADGTWRTGRSVRGRAEQRPRHGGRLEGPPRGHEQDRQVDQRDVRQQHGGEAVDEHEPAAAEPVAEGDRLPVAGLPSDGDRDAGWRQRDRRAAIASGAAARVGQADGGEAGGRERRRHRGGGAEQDPVAGAVMAAPTSSPVLPRARPPSQCTHARSAAAARSSSRRTGPTTNRPTAISS